jgi:hypothetical protein
MELSRWFRWDIAPDFVLELADVMPDWLRINIQFLKRHEVTMDRRMLIRCRHAIGIT